MKFIIAILVLWAGTIYSQSNDIEIVEGMSTTEKFLLLEVMQIALDYLQPETDVYAVYKTPVQRLKEMIQYEEKKEDDFNRIKTIVDYLLRRKE